MRPRCSILTGGFDFSGCGDCTSCPPFEHTEMSNSEPSAIVLQGIPCMCGLYKVSIREARRFQSQLATNTKAESAPFIPQEHRDGAGLVHPGACHPNPRAFGGVR